MPSENTVGLVYNQTELQVALGTVGHPVRRYNAIPKRLSPTLRRQPQLHEIPQRRSVAPKLDYKYILQGVPLHREYMRDNSVYDDLPKHGVIAPMATPETTQAIDKVKEDDLKEHNDNCKIEDIAIIGNKACRGRNKID